METNIPRNVIKELLLLYTKHVHFTFNGDIYIQVNSVAMGSPLGTLLPNVFMKLNIYHKQIQFTCEGSAYFVFRCFNQEIN